MAYPSQDTEVKVSSQGADSFVSWYYQDLNDGRSLVPYYVNSSPKYATAGIAADVTINGAQLNDPAAYDALLEEQRRGPLGANGADHNTRPSALKVRYEVASHDAQVLNNDYGLACPEHILERGPDPTGGRVSMLVTVMGTVHFGNGPDTEYKRFHEVFVLVPNWDVAGRRNPPRGAKKFLISSQNYRTL